MKVYRGRMKAFMYGGSNGIEILRREVQHMLGCQLTEIPHWLLLVHCKLNARVTLSIALSFPFTTWPLCSLSYVMKEIIVFF